MSTATTLADLPSPDAEAVRRLLALLGQSDDEVAS